MRKGLTEVVFILDRSGSMGGLESDTIGGFNSMMAKQKKEEGEAIVSTVLFDDQCEVLYNRIDMEQVPVMTDKDYYVRGGTALLDALGGAIYHICKVHKYTREDDRPEKTLFIITTDGMENASRHYSYEKIQHMVKRQQERFGWEFIFIGANIDSIAEAGKFGIREERAVNYVHDEFGTANVYTSISKAVSAIRTAPAGSYEDILGECNWDEDVRADYSKRGRK